MTLEAYGSIKTVGLDKAVKDAVALKQSIQKLIERSYRSNGKEKRTLKRTSR